MSIEFNNYYQNNLLKIKNNLNKNYSEFYIDCKNDYKKLINSFFNLLKKSNQNGGMPIKLDSINKRLLNSLSKIQGKNPRLPPINNFLNESSINNKGKLQSVQLPSINNFLNKSSRNNKGELRSVQLPSINFLLNENSRSINNSLSQKSTVLNSNSQQSNLQQSNNNSFADFNLNKKQNLHECKVFAYLNKKSKTFVDNSTCFLKCLKFKSGFIGAAFKQNCLGIGELSRIITLEKLIKSIYNKKLLLDKIKLILDRILKKINELHLLGVAHNNLICSKVTVINETDNIDIRFIDFKKASILDPSENINKVDLTNLYEAYKNFIKSLVF
jgi:hypothetical protein